MTEQARAWHSKLADDFAQRADSIPTSVGTSVETLAISA
jgi:hypothetical protein